MLFNSVKFAVFFPLVVILYYSIPQRWRWAMLLAASYYFYMCWKVEYVLLILASTAIDYFAAIQIDKHTEKRNKRLFLYLSLAINLGLLFAFKYFNFVNDNLRDLFQHFNIFYNVPSFNVLLPVGISFYTFQTLAYTIDVYRGKVKPERHPGIFALYVSFFPQLVAGPIERPKNLIPQFYEHHKFKYENISAGLKLMAWGFFKKVVIADRLAAFVEQVYGSPADFHGFQIAVAAFFFMFQLYADFSGYSDIAIGAARVMGFSLMINFDRPYISKSVSEFWKRWHISLSTWIKDYVFMPLSSYWRKGKIWGIALAGFISFFLFGLWHGAGWNFIAFGAIFGLLYAFEILTFRQRKRLWEKVPKWILNPAGVITIFLLIMLATIFFRAASINDAVILFRNLFDFNASQLSLHMISDDTGNFILSFVFILFLLVMQALQGNNKSAIDIISGTSLIVRWGFYVLLVYIIFNFGVFNNKEFFYFQF